ncbi:MAG: hypothetical protein LAO09_10060 [Acidobacteriia bacterium]|nr:hypothetical protein [Terriglobia bacterium]
MNVHFSYKDCKTPDVEKEINHLIEKLRKRLQVFRPDLVHLRGGIEQNSPREGTTVSLNLRLPSGQMAVQKSAPTASAAVKAACDELLQQIGKHKDLLRSTHKWSRRRVAGFRPESQVPFEETVAAIQVPMASSDDIRSYVNANLARLERFVERELYFRETADEMPPDSVTKEEVVDAKTGRLAMRAIDDLSQNTEESTSSVHLEDSARRRNVRGSDEAELQFHQPDETLTGESVIADRRTATPEDIASSDEMIALVQFALNGASRHDRESFILHAVEGFSVDEIAAITDRPPEEVRSSIASARKHVRSSVPIAGRFKDKLLGVSTTD